MEFLTPYLPYLWALAVAIPTCLILSIMGFFTRKDKFPVEGRVRRRDLWRGMAN